MNQRDRQQQLVEKLEVTQDKAALTSSLFYLLSLSSYFLLSLMSPLLKACLTQHRYPVVAK